MESARTVRVDKWLWAARFYKTRSVAQHAIDGDKVKLNGERTKSARLLKVGDRLSVTIGTCEWVIVVVALSEQRGPAPVARTLYLEDEESRTRREQEIAKRRHRLEPAMSRKGRPTKRDRRDLERWREGEG